MACMEAVNLKLREALAGGCSGNLLPPCNRAGAESYSINPRNSNRWVGMKCDFSRFITKPRFFSRYCAVAMSSFWPALDRFINKRSSR